MSAYDPEAHAEKVIEELLAGDELRNPQTGVTREVVSSDTYARRREESKRKGKTKRLEGRGDNTNGLLCENSRLLTRRQKNAG